MFDTGQVVPPAEFDAWIKQQQAYFAPVAKYLPPYATTYLPDPQLRRMTAPEEPVSAQRRRPPAAPDRLQPAHRRRPRRSAATTSAGSSATTSPAPSIDYFGDTDQNDISVFLGYFFGVDRLPRSGSASLNYPFARMRGYPPSLREKETQGAGRYFGLCTDHKVVGIQYLWGIGLFFFIGGLNAMLIRVELLRPNYQVFPAGQYLTLVGLHGTMMMGIMSSAILGPFANYFVPLMIGARRMAFPRIEALTFWLLMAAGAILTTTIFFGGFPTGWTGYEPLIDQANAGMDSYIVFFALVGISMCLLGLNMIATIMTMRAPGLTWSRLPIFVWGVALDRDPRCCSPRRC